MGIAMNKVKLGDVVSFSDKRIDAARLTVENYIGTDNILQNKEGKKDSLYVPTSGKTATYNAGDILVANIRPYLKKIWFATNQGGSSADVTTIRVKQEFDSKFVYYNLFQDEFFDFAMKGAKGSKMPRLDKNQILDFPIYAPNIATQKSIAQMLSLLDDKIALNYRINAKLEALARDLHNYWFVQFNFPDANNRPLLFRGYSWLRSGTQYA
ncbi:restriction endonuclease subunit S [Candidatus Saccharibacteria bacterium]|nr:restriction endonuclease subunit S [Candidatus Saccharibacteria bacterium]